MTELETLHVRPRRELPLVTTRPARATWALAVREAILLLRHPAHLIGVALLVMAVSTNSLIADLSDMRSAYSGPALVVVEFLGVSTFFAANLRVSRARRANAEELFEACPVSPAQRTLAACLATVAPFLVAWAVVAVLDGLAASQHVRLEDPGAIRLLGAALTVLGGGLLGIMVSRWMPFPGAAVIVMVGAVAACMYLQTGTNVLFSPFTDWAPWEPYSVWNGDLPGSPTWHAVYIGALGLMAAAGALLTHHRWRVISLISGAGAALGAGLAAFAQLP
jgi:hypothetical protein